MVTLTRKLSDFSLPLTFEDKMSIFQERIYGWYLNVADIVINGEKDTTGKILIEAIPHSAYGVLNIVLPYFEMIAKYQDGYVNIKKRKSSRYFKKGMFSVFPELSKEPKKIVDDLLDMFYKKVRCGLLHSYHTGDKIFITNEIKGAIGIQKNYRLLINPHILVTILKLHFINYIIQLKDVKNSKLRNNFEKKFDSDNSPII